MAMTGADARVGNQVAREVFAGLPARYDRLAYLLSFGQDRRWRRAVVDEVAAAFPRLALDVATGPAGVALAVARRTGARVAGVDLDEPMLRRGLGNVRASGLDVTLLAARAEQLPFRTATFDALSFSYLLRYVDDPAATLAELGRCVRAGGRMASLEFGVPPMLGWRWLWRAYVAAVLPALGLVTGGRAWWRVGRFLGPSIRGHDRQWPVERLVAAWEDAGFRDVRWRRMSVGGGLVMWGTKVGGL